MIELLLEGFSFDKKHQIGSFFLKPKDSKDRIMIRIDIDPFRSHILRLLLNNQPISTSYIYDIFDSIPVDMNFHYMILRPVITNNLRMLEASLDYSIYGENESHIAKLDYVDAIILAVKYKIKIYLINLSEIIKTIKFDSTPSYINDNDIDNDSNQSDIIAKTKNNIKYMPLAQFGNFFIPF